MSRKIFDSITRPSQNNKYVEEMISTRLDYFDLLELNSDESLVQYIKDSKSKIQNIIQEYQKTYLFWLLKSSSTNRTNSAISDESSSFYGGWENSVKKGFGVQLDKLSKNIYFGYFENNQFDGYGCILFGDSDGQSQKFMFPGAKYYLGKMKKGTEMSDCSLVIMKNGNIFEGSIRHSLDSSKASGILKLNDSKEYELYSGEFENGEYHGFGVIQNKESQQNSWLKKYQGIFEWGVFKSGFYFIQKCLHDKPMTFKGEWTSLMDGTGTIEHHQISTYTGGWKDLKKHGYGVLNFNSGTFYKGEFKNDKFDGPDGTYDWNYYSYTGSYENGLHHGWGTYKTKNCFEEFEYTGYFHQGNKHGNGTYKWPLFEYEGEFVNDKIEGEGIITFKSALIIDSVKGRFKAGTFDLTYDSFRTTYKNAEFYIGQISCQNFNSIAAFRRTGKGKYYYRPSENSTYTSYDGEWLDDEFSGQGTAWYTNGDKYTGAWLKSKREGKGWLSAATEKGQSVFEGTFASGEMSSGSVFYPNGELFAGPIKNNQRGIGDYIFNNGDKYTGSYSVNWLDGKGEITFKVSSTDEDADIKYTGHFKNSLFHSQSATLRNNKFEYTGSFIEGIRQTESAGSPSEIIFKNHEKFNLYSGEVSDGKMHGQGELTFVNGSVYKGKLKDDRLHDQNGLLNFNASSSYKGNFVEDSMTGEGVIKEENVFSYNGQVEDGRIEGKGIYTYLWLNSEYSQFSGIFNDGVYIEGDLKYRNGSTYNGDYKNNIPHGKGVLQFAPNNISGILKYEGSFIDGKFHSVNESDFGVVTFDDGRVFKGIFINGKQNGKGRMKSLRIKMKGNFLEYQLHGKNWISLDIGSGRYEEGCFNKGKIHSKCPLTGETVKWTIVFNRVTDNFVLKDSHKLESYVGMVENGNITGKGVYSFKESSNLEKYEGELKDGKRDGMGDLYFQNGDVLKAIWEKDSIISPLKSKYYYKKTSVSERRYVGELSNKNYIPHGKGKLFDGNLTYMGKFKDGKLHGPVKIIQKDEDGDDDLIFDGFFFNDKKHGTWKEYDSKKIEVEQVYANGQLTSVKDFQVAYGNVDWYNQLNILNGESQKNSSGAGNSGSDSSGGGYNTKNKINQK